jgi:hypothetical protein
MVTPGTVVATRGKQELILDGRGESGWSMAHIREGGTDYPSQKFVTLFALGGWQPLGSETAAGERRVRTPEGAEHYGQPIGAIITKDPLRRVKAHVPATVKWRDLKPGDRFIDATGTTMEVIKLQPWDSDAETQAFRSYALRNGVPLIEFETDAVLAAKAKAAWESQSRRMVLLQIDGRDAGHWAPADGVSNPEHEFQRVPSVDDPFMAEVVEPARAAMRALAEKYPDGVDQALSRAVHPDPGPEPQISEEMKRLWKESAANWEMQQVPNAQQELDEAEHALAILMMEFNPDPRKVEKAKDRLETAQDRREAVKLQNVGGDVARYYELLRAHQAEYAQWLEHKYDHTPTSSEALEILADVEHVGALVRQGIRVGIARAEAESLHMGYGVVNPAPTKEGVRRRLARRAVAELRGHADSTNQKWLTDFDMAKAGAQRGLTDEEKQMLTESLLFFPKDWVSGFDRLGQVTTDKSVRGYFGTEGTRRKKYHISLSDSMRVYGGGGVPSDGGEMQRVAVHEVGHGMERVIPGLGELEMVFWYKRTGKGGKVLLSAADGAEFPQNPLHPTARDYTLKYYGKTVPGHSLDKDLQKMFRSPDLTVRPESWEVFTTGVQEVLGDGFVDYTYRRDIDSLGTTDTELWDLTMGALLSLPGTPGYGLNLPPHGTMEAEEV